MSELKVQREIAATFKAAGGYGQKISSQFQIGVPDLLLAHPDLPPLLAEVKWLGDVPEKFNRKIDISAPQVNISAPWLRRGPLGACAL
jgi:hypothetical protein